MTTFQKGRTVRKATFSFQCITFHALIFLFMMNIHYIS